MNLNHVKASRAQISRAAIQRLYIAMRHLFIRGSYKPLGVSGEAMIDALLSLEPEIYGSIADPERVEIDGLLYVFQRLPQGIEECRYVKLIGREGLENSGFKPIVPSKRRRNCYRIDDEQMYIEMTRGRSDIYDILTHLTFMYIEAEKIRQRGIDSKNRKTRAWIMLEKIIKKVQAGEEFNKEVGYTYLSTLMGRTYEETAAACDRFTDADRVNDIFNVVYWLGKYSMDEHIDGNDREISFSSALRDKVGLHIYGELWANRIKSYLHENDLFKRPLHIISSNMHSVMNSLFAKASLGKKAEGKSLEEVAGKLSQPKSSKIMASVRKYALANGMHEIYDQSGANINVQIFDLAKMDLADLPSEISYKKKKSSKLPVLVVMDYAFGEQAFECMDELLKPYELYNQDIPLDVWSINIMGKAGILYGVKGDIMIPTSHVFEGTADNYPFENELTIDDFKGSGLGVYGGTMITVLGTSLQNRDILSYFLRSSWKAVGLEMEGAHYQKAIQSASKIRNSVNPNLTLRYAYYASDNPLESGSTLASGSLGLDGVKPTYLISTKFLSGILAQNGK
jgi:hypothetical protein